jgi:Domain of unknown function DUF11
MRPCQPAWSVAGCRTCHFLNPVGGITVHAKDEKHRTGRFRRRQRLLGGSLVAVLVVGFSLATQLVSGGSASAAASANLSITQKFSGSSTSGSTIDTVTIHNAGTDAASNLNLSMYLKTTSSNRAVGSNAGTCELAPAPAGFQVMAACQLGALASGSDRVVTLTWSGTAGTAFTSTVTIGSTTADPNAANNISTASSYFGPRADLSLTQTASPGATAGKATVVSTVTNKGPNTANALQMVTEINSPGYSSVNATSNLSSSCQFIPPAAGFNRAVLCTTNLLGPGVKWIVTFAYTGTAAASLQVQTSVSANNPPDPVTTNNMATSSTTYHS